MPWDELPPIFCLSRCRWLWCFLPCPVDVPTMSCRMAALKPVNSDSPDASGASWRANVPRPAQCLLRMCEGLSHAGRRIGRLAAADKGPRTERFGGERRDRCPGL
ncbi:unnamed protein product [Lota lota]